MKRGSIMLLVLVFGSIFFIILAASIQFILVQNRLQNMLLGRAQSFSIAEAGINYYGWFLSHFPNNFENGTGQPGPYVITYNDPLTGDPVGTYTLSIEGSSACGTTQAVTVTSQGSSIAFPEYPSTITATYSSPSVAGYSQITSANPPAGVTFSQITPDFAALKTAAQASGIYLPPRAAPESPHNGYHLIFNSNGTLTVRLVTNTTQLNSVRTVDAPATNSRDNTLIRTESLYQASTIPTDCGLIFVEANAWIEGTIPSKVTVVAAKFVGGGSGADVMLKNNVTYAATDGTAGLTVIAERNIKITADSPTNMTLHGIFVAVDGYFGRNNYFIPSGGCTGLYEARGSLTILGTIVSNYTPQTKWSNLCSGGGTAGYQTQSLTVDTSNATNPPPYTPTTSSTKSFINWQQTQ